MKKKNLLSCFLLLHLNLIIVTLFILVLIIVSCSLSPTEDLDCSPILPKYIYAGKYDFNTYSIDYLLKTQKDTIIGFGKTGLLNNPYLILDKFNMQGKSFLNKPKEFVNINYDNIKNIILLSDTSFIVYSVKINRFLYQYPSLEKYNFSGKLIDSVINIEAGWPINLVKCSNIKYLSLTSDYGPQNQTIFRFYNKDLKSNGTPITIDLNLINTYPKLLWTSKEKLLVLFRDNKTGKNTGKLIDPIIKSIINISYSDSSSITSLNEDRNGNIILSGSHWVSGQNNELFFHLLNSEGFTIYDTIITGTHVNEEINFSFISTFNNSLNSFIITDSHQFDFIQINVSPFGIVSKLSTALSTLSSPAYIIQDNKRCLIGLSHNSDFFKCNPYGQFE